MIDIKEAMDQATKGLGGKKRPAHGKRHTHIEHLDDNSHMLRVTPYDGEEESYSAKDHNELAAKIKEILGAKEEAAEGDTKQDSPSEESAEKA